MTAPGDAVALLRRMLDAAIQFAQPAQCVPQHLPSPPAGRTLVVGAGKAAAAMARAVEDHWRGPLDGLVVTRYGHGVPTRRIRVVEAAHPVPDAKGAEAAADILALTRALGPRDLLLCLISGGGSALLSLPAPGLTLDDKIALSQRLLRSGARISEINCVRRHLSAIKGGRLAAASRAPVVTLAISDVPGDDPAIIASGPTVPDGSLPVDALAILSRYGVEAAPPIRRHLEAAGAGPRPDDPGLARNRMIVVANAQMALDAAASVARAAGYELLVLSDALEGEARDLAKLHAALARQIAAQGAPTIILSGGEATVTLRGEGRGGRNGEFLLGLVAALDGMAGIYALAADTDGIDGSEDNAGAILTPDTPIRARAAGLDIADHLARNDSYGFFAGLGDLVITGPTRTNVNDFRAVLVERGERS